MTCLFRTAVRVLALAVLAWPGSSRAEDASATPFELVRSLRASQDRIAHGDTVAQAGQRKLLAEIGAGLLRADAASWKDPRNARAAVIYVLSGGDPAVLRKLRDLGLVPGIEERLVNGTLAYSEGRSGEAELLLMEIDTRPLDSSIAGHIALVQSGLALKKDVNKAVALLDEARLRSPGTLVEEAALRREAFLVLAAGNRDRFDILSSSYLRRFGDSYYAGSFRRQFAAQVTGEKYAIDSKRLKKLKSMLDVLEPVQRLELYLAIAEEGVVRGKVEAVEMAAENVLGLARDANVTRTRAELYRGAVRIAADRFDSGVADLKSIDKSLLEQRDAELLEAANSIAGQVRVWPETGESIGGLQDLEAKAEQAEQPIVQATSKSLAMAQRAVSQVDQMLNGAAK